MDIHSLGIRTALGLIGHDTQVTHHTDHLIVKTPSNPHYHWGNYVVFANHAKWHNQAACETVFERAFGNSRDIEHQLFVWDSNGESVSWANDTTCALTLEGAAPNHISAYQVKAISTDEQWQAVLESQYREMAGPSDSESRTQQGMELSTDLKEMIQRRYQHYQALVRAGKGQWFGAFAGDVLVGNLGLFEQDGYLRFQNVEVHPSYRRQGIARHLLCEAIHTTRQSWHNAVCVIESDPQSPAFVLYQRLGFSVQETLTSYLAGSVE